MTWVGHERGFVDSLRFLADTVGPYQRTGWRVAVLPGAGQRNWAQSIPTWQGDSASLSMHEGNLAGYELHARRTPEGFEGEARTYTDDLRERDRVYPVVGRRVECP